MASLVRYSGNVGSLIIAEPPLFLAVLAMLKLLTGAEPFVIARYLNATLFGLVIFLCKFLLNRFFRTTPLFVIVGTISVLISYSLVSVYLMELTEPLFILFVLMFMFFLNSYLTKPTRTSLLWLSLSTTLAFLTRYVGAVLIVVGVICIIIFSKSNWKNKMRQSIIIHWLRVCLQLFGWSEIYVLLQRMLPTNYRPNFLFLKTLSSPLTTSFSGSFLIE